MSRRSAFILASLAWLAVSSAPAAAAVRYIGSATVEDDDLVPRQSGGQTFDQPMTYGVQHNGNFATATASDTGGGLAGADAFTQNGLASASASVAYNFDLVGPDAAFVPIRVLAKGLVQTEGYAHAGGSFSLSYFDGLNEASGSLFRSISDFGPLAFSIDQVIYIRPNTRSFLALTATASVGVGYIGPGDDGIYAGLASAYVDPVFTIDAAYADRYRLVGIPGAGSGPGTVPEPGAWALLILGFGGVGAAARRQRTRGRLEAVAPAAQRLLGWG